MFGHLVRCLRCDPILSFDHGAANFSYGEAAVQRLCSKPWSALGRSYLFAQAPYYHPVPSGNGPIIG